MSFKGVYMYRLALFLFLLSSSAFAHAVQETSFDLGLDASPTFTPETGYTNVHLRLGLEVGVTFFKYEDTSLAYVFDVGRPTTLKFVRLGLGYIGDKPVVLFSPLSVRVKDSLYLSPSFGFGKDPYTVISFSYDLSS